MMLRMATFVGDLASWFQIYMIDQSAECAEPICMLCCDIFMPPAFHPFSR